MKFPKREPGKYARAEEANEKCGCGAKLYFESYEIFKFCSSCGQKHNKMRYGTSSYSYSGVISDDLRRLVNPCMEIFFETDVKSNGPGMRQYSLSKWHSPEVGGYIDASKGIITLSSESIYIEVNSREDGAISNVSMEERTYNTKRFELTDEEIFKMTKPEMEERIMHELKGLWSNQISEGYYKKKRNMIEESTLNEIKEVFADFRARKKYGIHIPKDMDSKVGAFHIMIRGIEDEVVGRSLGGNFNIPRPTTVMRNLKNHGDAIVLSLRSRDKEDTLIMYSEVKSGQYSRMEDFEFSSDKREFFVKIKGEKL